MSKKKNEPEKLDWVLADLLELPKDLVLDLPRITIVGQRELALENHKGIIEYGTEQIKINLARGYLEIDGEALELKFIMQDELSIVGKINALRFVD
ncbi:MAG: sporulation protein YqfC [Acidobacteriota bacterium]